MGVVLVSFAATYVLADLYIKAKRKQDAETASPRPSPNLKQIKDEEVEISGWIAWWKEPQAYSLINKYPDSFTTISPVWFLLDNEFELHEVGKLDKPTLVAQLHNYGLKVIPSLGSEIKSDQLSLFLNDATKTQVFLDSLISRAAILGVDGIDIDLEDIKLPDKAVFTSFIGLVAQKTREHKLILSVTLHAKTGHNDWSGSLGQDTKQIATLADEVRIMAYDYHTKETGPGANTPTNWLENVIAFSLQNVPKEKLIIGLPTYGYMWAKDGTFTGYQYDDFLVQAAKSPNTVARDETSGELIYSSSDYIGWLSDAQAVKYKIGVIKSAGLTKVILWNLGGMDKEFFNR